MDPPDIVHTLQAGTQSTMNTKDLAGDDGRDGESVEHVDKCLPDLDVCPALALVVETVYYIGLVIESTRGRKGAPLVTLAHSWLPRKRKKFSGYLIL